MAEKTLGVPIQHVVLIKMDGLAQLVDALGGVTVKLDCPLYEQTPDPKNPNRVVNWSLPAGEVTLNGEEARKFATYRYLTSDFGRAQRQQQLIWAIRNQAEEPEHRAPHPAALERAFRDVQAPTSASSTCCDWCASASRSTRPRSPGASLSPM